MNPVVVSLHGNAGYAGILQGQESFDGTGESTGEDLAGVEEVAGDEDKIDPLRDGAGHNAPEHAEEVFVTFGFAKGGPVGLPQVDICGMDIAHYISFLKKLERHLQLV